MINNLLKMVLAFSVAICMFGCDAMEIEKVKGGTLNDYKQTTIGKAIESSFGDVEWKYFETDKGVKVVEAKGWPGKKTIYAFFLYQYGALLTKEDIGSLDAERLLALRDECAKLEKVVIQFIFHANSDEFEVGFCGLGTEPMKCNRLLQHIYDNDTHYESVHPTCSAVNKAISKVEKAHAEAEASKYGTFTDNRDGSLYKTVVIGGKTWMAENLKYKTEKSHCYNNEVGMCAKYGRLYDWDDAIKACPEGWHLPSWGDFDKLFGAARGGDFSKAEGNILKASVGWNGSEIGTDDVGFSALPGGYHDRIDNDPDFPGHYQGEGSSAGFWSSSEATNEICYAAYHMSLSGDSDMALASAESCKSWSLSVRCVKD